MSAVIASEDPVDLYRQRLRQSATGTLFREREGHLEWTGAVRSDGFTPVRIGHEEITLPSGEWGILVTQGALPGSLAAEAKRLFRERIPSRFDLLLSYFRK